MNMKTFTIVSALIFALVALMHLARLVLQWDVIVGGHVVPAWVSVVSLVVAGFLSFAGFRLAQQIHKFLS